LTTSLESTHDCAGLYLRGLASRTKNRAQGTCVMQSLLFSLDQQRFSLLVGQELGNNGIVQSHCNRFLTPIFIRESKSGVKTTPQFDDADLMQNGVWMRPSLTQERGPIVQTMELRYSCIFCMFLLAQADSQRFISPSQCTLTRSLSCQTKLIFASQSQWTRIAP